MAKTINFNNAKKRYMTVVLPDRDPLTLRMPSKRILEGLMELEGDLDGLGDEGVPMGSLDGIYDVIAQILSRNREGVTVTQAEVEELLDMEDLTVLLDGYMSFISEGVTSKN